MSKAAFRLTTCAGIEQLLPTAEAEIMQLLWANGPQKVRPLHRQIATRRDVAYTTVMTTCSRMADKGLLSRTLSDDGASYVYAPTLDETAFVAQVLAQLLDRVSREYPAALSSYLDSRHNPAAH